MSLSLEQARREDDGVNTALDNARGNKAAETVAKMAVETAHRQAMEEIHRDEKVAEAEKKAENK